MPDREKVIKALENCNAPEKCRDCPWEPCEEFDCKHSDYPDGLIGQAIALLKAQEPVKPIRMNHDENKYRDHYRCPICDDDLTYEQQYCAECGRAVKWDG